MKNYTKYMKKIDGMLEMAKPEKKTPASGLLAPAKLPKRQKKVLIQTVRLQGISL